MTKVSGIAMTTGKKGNLPFVKRHPWGTVLSALLLILGVVAGSVYVIQARQAATTTTETAPQTATVRQGDLLISASGTGTLAVTKQYDLAFTSSGQVKAIFVKPGDHVEAGTVLAQVDDTQAQVKYEQAKQSYLELTSEGGIASAQEQVVKAQSALMSAKYKLEYLIGPDVMYWETEIAKGQQDFDAAKARVEASPSDEDAKKAFKKANDFLVYAEGMLNEAWQLYYDEYVPATFRLLEDRNDKDIYAVPTELEIRLACTAIDEAQKELNDSQEYYAVLTGSPMPQVTDNQYLITLQQTKRDMQDAQDALEGTSITTPIAGTILSVDTSVGDTVDTSTVISMADLSQLELDFYLDETDWALAAVGDQVEVSFDTLPDQTFNGQVSALDRALYQSGNTSVVKGVAQLGNALEGVNLPIGTSASIDIIHARADNAVLVPIEALYETAPGKYEVFLVQNDTLTQRTVEIGLQDQFYAEVKSGLQAGDVVSTQPAQAN